MERFSQVLQSLRNWFESFRWYPLLRTFELHLLFGGLAVMLLREICYQVLPYSSYHALGIIFHTIPLYTIAYQAFLIGIWLTLVSSNVKYTPYGLWLYAFVYLFPFTGMSLETLIKPAIFVLLGTLLFRFSVSSYSENSAVKY